MRPAERLLPLLQMLRRHRRPVTAETLAGELEVSIRTIYRDIAGLIASGVPIRGEAGIGYVLGDGYDLPPLMFTPDEVEAVLLGMKWVEARGDAGLKVAAADVVAKIAVVLPRDLVPILADAGLAAPMFHDGPPPESIDVAALRLAIRERRKVRIAYADAQGVASRRLIWPLAIGYFEVSRNVVAWCELRNDFRHFRTDRMVAAEVLEERYRGSRQALLAKWRVSRMDGISL